jgi:hypothetical protein
MKLINVFIVVAILFSWKILAQSEYSKYIVANSQGKIKYIKNKYGDERINYLGVVRKKNGENLYHIFTVFKRVQAAVVMHGHSTIIFIGKDKKEKKRYELSFPEELPYKLKNNTLYFKYLDKTTQTKKIFKSKIGIKIPEMICVEPASCY